MGVVVRPRYIEKAATYAKTLSSRRWGYRYVTRAMIVDKRDEGTGTYQQMMKSATTVVGTHARLGSRNNGSESKGRRDEYMSNYDAWLERPYQQRAKAESAYEWAQQQLLAAEEADCYHTHKHKYTDCPVCYDQSDGLSNDVTYNHMYEEHGGCEFCEEQVIEWAREDAAERKGEAMMEARREEYY